ncbi:MAG: hypothetical protein DWC11_03025 [Candidatus Poseidoniales archaeon]|nr:MAG: hypothetical protein DWC11_03025 [Candidatus Poseidoniales archaeon]
MPDYIPSSKRRLSRTSSDQRSSIGVREAPRGHHDEFNERPNARDDSAETKGQDGDEELGHGAAGVPKVEIVSAKGAQEKGQQHADQQLLLWLLSHHHLALTHHHGLAVGHGCLLRDGDGDGLSGDHDLLCRLDGLRMLLCSGLRGSVPWGGSVWLHAGAWTFRHIKVPLDGHGRIRHLHAGRPCLRRMAAPRPLAVALVALLLVPLAGCFAPVEGVRLEGSPGQFILEGQTLAIPPMTPGPLVDETAPWWERTTLDLDQNGIHDALDGALGPVWVGLSYGVPLNDGHVAAVEALGLQVSLRVPAVDALLLGEVDASALPTLRALDDVVMVESYGELVFWGDVQTPAVKASSSSVYPDGAWDLGVSGEGVVIAMVDTGVDNEHPGLNEKFVAGYDAVCFLHSMVHQCVAAGGRAEDGSFDPDDGHQHGTACMGMAAATGKMADGSESNFTGSAPDAALVDVRIGTDVGAGPFENYLISQEFYESAMNGLQWIIDHKDDAWAGADESEHGIDIISLSWGITSHEGGGSDGEDMHSRILNEAMEAGIVVSVAAGNDGPDNDGLSGMGSSSLSITVGATDDKDTIDREDDTIAGYSSRGPRRDNGDGNPLNELKPEVTAPGTNIVQAEGCVTSAGCHNDVPGQDAADNGYTNRGSGTSYATPSVSGIIALMMEANPDLSPMEIKEILKFTAERRGEPSAPDVDPYWNRDFGWGMVDARAAVEMSLLLVEQGTTGSIDVSAQVHVDNLTESSDMITLTGQAWAQGAPLLAVEYRVDGGEWRSVTFDVELAVLASLERMTWTLALDPGAFGAGLHDLEIRAITDDGVSLSSFATFTGSDASETMGGSASLTAVVVVVVAVALTVAVLVQSRTEAPVRLTESDDPKSTTPPPSLEGDGSA